MRPISLLLVFVCSFFYSYGQANFNIPDTVCANQQVYAVNTTVGGNTFYWDFCSGGINSTPTGSNLGNLGSLATPVRSAFAKDNNGNYYLFVTNYATQTISRLSFGNSPMNVPVGTNLGNIGGLLPSQIQGIQVKFDNGNWYGFVLGGNGGSAMRMVRLDFGTSLSNIPTVTDFGNVGGLLSYPIGLEIFKFESAWYGFTVNSGNFTILRFNFGNSLLNTPTVNSLGNVGSLNKPTGITLLNDNNNWYAFIVNTNSHSITRLSFGNSLLNTPTGTNLGNINGLLNYPFDITLIKDCGKVFGLIAQDAQGTTNNVLRIEFPNGIGATPALSTLGNFAGFNKSQGISDVVRHNENLFCYVTNAGSNSISRIIYSSCNNAPVASSALFNPPAFSFSSLGTYNVNLTVDEGMPTQTNLCKSIVVNNPVLLSAIATSHCDSIDTNGEIDLTVSSGTAPYSYNWSNSSTTQDLFSLVNGTYSATVTDANGCIANTSSIVTDHCGASFDMPQSVCVNQPINIVNTTAAGSTYYWNHCPADINKDPWGVNQGDIGLSYKPVRSAFVKDNNGNYFLFIITYNRNTLIRCSFGNDPDNAPIVTDLGNPSGVIPIQGQSIQVKFDNGNWYAFVVGGLGTSGHMARLNFGSSLSNTPTGYNLGSFGGLLYTPSGLEIFEYADSWYGFVSVFGTNKILRLDFGTELNNIPPVVTDLGNVGTLTSPTGFHIINENNNWYAFVINTNSNSISRLDFGNSFLNTPTGTNLGNLNGLLNYPYDITLIKDCGKIFGLISNNSLGTTNNMLKIDFPNGINATPTLYNMGNFANFDMPEGISELLRFDDYHDNLFGFVTNAGSNTISRIFIPSCSYPSTPSSALFTPPAFSFSNPGTYKVNLVVDEGLPTQSILCKNIVVNGSGVISAPVISSNSPICSGGSIQLFADPVSGVTYTWTGPNGFTSNLQNPSISNADISNSGYYKLNISNGCASQADSIFVQVNNGPVLLTNVINAGCYGASNGSVSVSASGGTPPYTYLWNNGATTSSISGLTAGNYSVTVTDALGCSSVANASVTQPTALVVNTSATDATCGNADGSASANVSGGTTPYTYLWSNGSTSGSINGLAAGTYSVIITDAKGCTAGGSATVADGCGCNYVTINTNNFESGWGIWNDGGGDVALVSNATYANSGTYSVQLRDDEGVLSSITTNNTDLSAASELTVNFSYYPTSMETGEGFWLQISTNGGSSFTTIASRIAGSSFVNDQRYNETVVYAGTFTTNTQLRFQCNASANNDWVYIDDIIISGCQGGGGPIPTCTDGIQNGSETGIDCGGSCAACPTCTDGIQNGNETGIDCGGSCAACPTCFDGVQNGNETGVDCGGSCAACPTCSDGVQNGSETGIDCGGTCPPCGGGGCNYVAVNSTNFESGWGIWNDGGSNCTLVSDINFASSGTYSVQLKSNLGIASSTTTNALNLSLYDEVTIQFTFKTSGLGSGKNFLLQYATGGTYTTAATYVAGTSFSNGIFYTENAVITGPFNSNTTFRFVCVAPGKNSYVYIDDIVITGCLQSSLRKGFFADDAHDIINLPEAADNVKIYPNPATSLLHVLYSSVSDKGITLIITDVIGRTVYQNAVDVHAGDNEMNISLSQMEAGVYMVSFIGDEKTTTKRLVITK